MQSMQLLLLLFARLINVTARDMAVNDHLLVVYRLTVGYPIVEYQCLKSISQVFEKVQLTLNESNLNSVAIGKRQSESQMYFVVFGTIGERQIYAYHMTKVTVPCNSSGQVSTDSVYFDNTTFRDAASPMFDVSPDGRFALGSTDQSVLIFDLTTLQHSSRRIDWLQNFRPMAVEISDRYALIAGYSENDIEIRMLYLLTVNFESATNCNVTLDGVKKWNGQGLGRGSTVYSLSVSGDANPRILLALTYPSAVHLLIVNESMQLHHISSHTGINALLVTWLHQRDTCRAVLLTERKELLVYNMGKYMKFDTSTVPSSKFMIHKQIHPQLPSLSITALKSSYKKSNFYLFSDVGKIFILPASQPGYYSVQNLFPKHDRIVPFIPDSAQCPVGTYKNDSGFWSCSSCQQFENISGIDPVSLTCRQCAKKEYCPGEFITPLDHFEDVTQNLRYPESPEIDVFDEILLYNMFRPDCGITSPLFLSIMALSVVLMVSVFIILMKHTKRLGAKWEHLLSFFRHLDLIGQGELWFGGLVTMALLFLFAFASQLSHTYHQQYPIEKQQQQLRSLNPCQSRELLNSRFETSLQLLSTASDEHEQIFYLLDNQPFIVNMELIQTHFNCEQLRLQYIEKRADLSFSCEQKGGVLYVSATLPVHKMSLNVILYGDHTTGSVRFGLSAKQVRVAENIARDLKFSKRFNSSHSSRLARNARIDLELTKVINVTEGLTGSDETAVSGLWLPTFTSDADQMFVDNKIMQGSGYEHPMENGFDLTTLSIYIRETAVFVKNKQKPIARRSEIIFHAILFAGVCIDLLATLFLLLKLWLIPLLKFSLRRFLRPTSWLYCVIFDRNDEDTEHHISPDVVRLDKEVNTLKVKLQENNDNMQAFICRVAGNNRSSVSPSNVAVLDIR